MLLLQLLVNGVELGVLYALIAAGFALIFGSTRVFHFAHGAAFVIASYLFYYVYAIANLGWAPAILAATAGSVVFGVIMDRAVYAPIQRHETSFFTMFVASLGAAIIVQNAIGMYFGTGFISVTTPLSRSAPLIAGLYASPLSGIAVLCALVLFGALQLFLTRTYLGMSLRALSDNPELIRVYGLSARSLSTVAFAIGSALVVPGAIIIAAKAGLDPRAGNHVMLISLAATIVGGVGSLRGAALAGLLLGVLQDITLAYVGPQWSGTVPFIILFFFIVFKPAGFFGRAATS